MATDKTLDSVNAKLAKALGLVKEIDRYTKSIASNSSKVSSGINQMTSGAANPAVGGAAINAAAGAGAGGLMARTFGRFSTKTPQSSNPTMQPGQSQGVAPGGGNGNLLSGSLGTIGAAATMMWNITPGVRDYAANQAALFPTAFGLQGQYSNQRAMDMISKGIGTGASGFLDPKAAAALGSVAGLSGNLGSTTGGNSMMQALGAASFSYQMMGMNNVAAMQGQVSLYQGGGPGASLSRIGIFTMDPASGKTKDMGQIADELWKRWYPSGKKVSMEEFDANLLGGFMGADLRAMFGGSPLYEQMVSFLRVKVKAGGLNGMTMAGGGSNSVSNVAKRYGLEAINTPTIEAGATSASRMKTVDMMTTSGMQGYNSGQGAIQGVNGGLQAMADLMPGVVGGLTSLKTTLDTFVSSGEGSGITGFVTGVVKSFVPFAKGGGNSTGDMIDAKISPGEFIVNARATKKHLNLLKSINDSGHEFGSAFASPAGAFAGGGLPNDPAQAVQWALNSTNGDATFPHICDHYVGLAYGKANSGYETAAKHWYATPSEMRHPGDLNPPPGALTYWDRTDSNNAGHVAIAVGGGDIVTTHTNGGKPTRMALSGVMQGSYLGWANPYYQGDSEAVGTSTTAASAAESASVDSTSSAGPNIMTSTTGSAGSPGGLSGLTYQSIMGTSLAPLGKSGGELASFTSANLGPLGATPIMATAGSGGIYKINKGSKGSLTDPTGGSASSSSTPSSGPGGNLVSWLRAAGFQGERLREAWAIAMRESGGRPNAHNPVPPDDSYGLFQINMLGPLEAARNAKFKQYVPGYVDKLSLYDPIINAKAAAYMSQRGANWNSWVSPQYGTAAKYYDEYAKSASQGSGRTKAGVLNVHDDEMILDAENALTFRTAMRDFLANGRSGPQQVSITLKIERASEDEAEKFARTVINLLEDDAAMKRLAGAGHED